MRLVCISDTHSMHTKIPGGVPPGDVLIHAGDFTGRNNKIAVGEFLEWLASLPHPHKILIAGNHDGVLEAEPDWSAAALAEICPAVHYLCDTGCEIDGVKFFGQPWTPEFLNWHFMVPRGEPAANKWALIPSDTDVLITHGPPHGILDQCPEWHPKMPRDRRPLISVGCEELGLAVNRLQPRVHVFGHIHEGHGRVEKDGTLFVNASCLDGRYRPTNAAQVVDI